MAAKDKILKYKLAIEAPLNEIYSAFVNGEGLCEWLCSVAHVDAHKGGRIYLWWENGYYANGEFIELIPGDRVVFSWHGKGEPGGSRVKVTFKPQDKGTLVSLSHLDLGSGAAWKQARRAIKHGWALGLENLKCVMETGQDLRFSHRPMLGFTSMQALNPESAEKIGLPPKPGLLVLGVIDGMCAANAGLRSGDYLVKFGGQKIENMPELNNVLNQHRAGNKVKLSYYRDGKKYQVKGELSQRPMPTIPGDAESLSLALSKMYDQLDVQLDEILKDLSIEQLDLRNSPTDWSIRETLGHLIAAERETHGWIARIIEGQEADFILRSNQPVRVRATISTFPSPLSLISELKRNQEETVAMVADLPSEFMSLRRRYWRLALELLQNPPLHYQEHLGLMRHALEKNGQKGPEPSSENIHQPDLS